MQLKGRTKPLYIYLSFLGLIFFNNSSKVADFWQSLSFKIFSKQTFRFPGSNQIELIDNGSVMEIIQESFCVLE